MSKPYFAIWLVVDGKVKEGNCLDTIKNEIIYYNGDYGEKTPDELKPVKLFLCVKNILPETFVRSKTSTTKFRVLEVLEANRIKIEFGHGESIVSKNDFFNAVGEISPKAFLIKEGDEFNEDDIKITEQCPHYEGKHMWKDCSCKSGFVKGVLIRCSRGHFH